jgi:hypothetical protein
MIEILINQMKQIANAERAERISAKYGRISAYNPEEYVAKVILYPEEVETGWLPIGIIWGGPEWGIYCGPHINMPCKVSFPEDDINNGIIEFVVNLGEFRPVSEVASGEFLIQHSSGSLITFKNDGSVEIKGSPVKIEGGDISVTGSNVTVEGSSVNIGDSGGTFRKVMAESAVSIYNNHTHTNNGADPPNPQLSSADLSGVTKVN